MSAESGAWRVHSWIFADHQDRIGRATESSASLLDPCATSAGTRSARRSPTCGPSCRPQRSGWRRCWFASPGAYC
jgi:hypothetical protein